MLKMRRSTDIISLSIKGDPWVSGTIYTYQKCPQCGMSFPTSKGIYPIKCDICNTIPTKYIIDIYWKGKNEKVSRDRNGRPLHSFEHAASVLGELRNLIDRARRNKGIVDFEAYRKKSSSSFEFHWNRFVDGYSNSVGTHDKLKSIGAHLTYFHEFQMNDILAWHIFHWWTELGKTSLSARYRNDILQWLKTFFSFVYRENAIDEEPRNYPKPESLPDPDIDDWLTFNEQRLILPGLPKYDQPIFDFLFRTGARVGEAIGLQISDTNWPQRITVIQHTIKRDGSMGTTKNKSKRIIPHTQGIHNCLKAAMKISGLHGYQFVNKWGRRYSDDYLRDRFYEVCSDKLKRVVKLKNATRHSWGMQRIEEGHDMWLVSKGFGHSSTKMTEHYVKVMARQLKPLYEDGKGEEYENRRP